jgi:HEAT repeat protein
MPDVQFCSNCHAENLLDAAVCERCGTPLSETGSNSFDQKLILALQQPNPEMRDMAAILLAQRGNRYAIPVLLSRLREETDIGTLNAIIQALAQLGDCEAVSSLTKCLAQPHALEVALAIVDALASLAQMGCWEALNVLKAPPPVSERVEKEIAAKLATLTMLYY